MRGSIVSAALIALLVAASVSAQTNPMADLKRFNGTVEARSGTALKVKTAEPGSIELRLTPTTRIMTRHAASLADVGANSFIGCTAVEQPGGELQATECHIFPESMRGAGEGHNPMGPPATTMTNGSVTTMTNGSVQSTDGKANSAVLKIAYKEGTKDIHVTPTTSWTMIAVGDAAMLKPGAKVSGGARAAADGGADVVMISVTP
jgi:hypothetical protein